MSEVEVDEFVSWFFRDTPVAPTARLQRTGSVTDLLRLADPLEEAANEPGIFNVFDDGGFRTLLLAKLFGLKPITGKAGDDAVDHLGRRVELKTVNRRSSTGRGRNTPGITTEHTLHLTNIQRYRNVDVWVIGVFFGNYPMEVWEVDSKRLIPWYTRWETEIRRTGHPLNNPKIPFAFIRNNGVKHQV